MFSYFVVRGYNDVLIIFGITEKYLELLSMSTIYILVVHKFSRLVHWLLLRLSSINILCVTMFWLVFTSIPIVSLMNFGGVGGLCSTTGSL